MPDEPKMVSVIVVRDANNECSEDPPRLVRVERVNHPESPPRLVRVERVAPQATIRKDDN
jgi:hypothetical protein